ARSTIADVIDVRVRQEHDVDVAESWIGFVDGMARIVEDADAGWIFKQHGTVASTQFAIVGSKRRDLHEPLRTSRTSHDYRHDQTSRQHVRSRQRHSPALIQRPTTSFPHNILPG